MWEYRKNSKKIIFERLYKVDKSRSINKEGTGIGLYIVKSMLSAHGKDIKVKSVEGEYAEFSFILTGENQLSKEEVNRYCLTIR